MKRSLIVSLTLLALGCVVAFGQSNEMIDELLAKDIADFDSSLYLILSAGGLIDESTSPEQAYEAFRSLGWRLTSKERDDSLTMRELSYLIMRSLGVNGGVMYTIFPSPRYAFRELVYKGVISRQVPPDRVVSGEQVVRYLGAVLRLEGGE